MRSTHVHAMWCSGRIITPVSRQWRFGGEDYYVHWRKARVGLVGRRKGPAYREYKITKPKYGEKIVLRYIQASPERIC